MNKLNTNELKELKGGFGGWFLAGIVAATIFVVGVLDGITRPLKCN